MTTFLKIGRWTLKLEAIHRLYDHLPERNVIEVESSTGGFDNAVQFKDEHADILRAAFAEGSDEVINVIDLMPGRPPEQRRQTWDGVTMRDRHERESRVQALESQVATLKESYERVNKANVGLVNQLIDIDTAARALISGAAGDVFGDRISVERKDLIALREAIGELRADRHLEYEGANS